jgi:hypothetical protein
MKWIVLAIGVFIVGYTYLTLHFRKPGRAYRPYEDTKNRINTERLLAAGYQRIVLAVERPTDAGMKGSSGMPAPGGLPLGLKTATVSAPLLPVDILDAHAAGSVAAGEPYVVQFRCLAPDDHQQLGGAELYVRGEEIVLTPNYERLGNGLQYRTRETFANAIVPAGTLKPGSYRITLVGERTSRAWQVQVR